MARWIAVLLALVVLRAAAPAAPLPKHAAPSTFLVQDGGLAFLGLDGREKERLDRSVTNGALSPDGRWLACVAFKGNPLRGKLALRPRGRAGDPVTIPLVWDTPGMSGCLPVWAGDGKRVLIGENRSGKDGALEYNYRVYDLRTKRLTELRLPDGHWVTGWSPDRKRFVTTFRGGGNVLRIAWLSADGTGRPDFITSEEEVAYGARLSRDGRRLLFLAGPSVPKGAQARMRLCVMDLEKKQRRMVDEPGQTHGYCWSPDGSQVAYTWQRSLANPAKVAERETLLITCDIAGRNHQIVTKRKYAVPANSSGRSGIVIFFEVLDWR